MKPLLFTAHHAVSLLLGKLTKNVSVSFSKFSVSFYGKNCQNTKEIMKVLNVAEKNDAAKNIAGLLGRGNCRRREGLSKFNKIYEFELRLWNTDCQMMMTSVSGHLLGFDFVGAYRKWQGCHPLSLFDAEVVKMCSDDNYIKIKKTLEREIKYCSALIIWTDCDREGENIGFEIIQVCKAVKPNIKVYRAKFSEITTASINRAIQTLGEPNKAVSDAVDVRSELDLRIGAAFTRFQTLRLQKVFPRNLADMLISYGSCQFPTLGFVVERYLAIERFKPEPYWKLKVSDVRDDISVEFRWARYRLFEELPCRIFLEMCQESPDATVERVTNKPKSKWRPLPLDTIELEKQGSRKLRLNAKETMKVAEKLYTQGFISYPRTETNIFPKELNLRSLVEQQANHQAWGEFANRVLNDGIAPRAGKKSDQAHPPIHPTKFTDNLQGNEAKVYEFVVRHFLACISKNAEGYETTVEIDIAGEKFTATGLQIIAKNYLDVYIYEKWNAKEIHLYEQGHVFTPTGIEMVEEQTSAPNLLTEADLIALMDKHGIGTDATHAEHIETIKSRQYVGLRNNIHFIPGKLGIGLVMGYDNMGFQMSKPNLRAELENDLKLICEGQKNPVDVLKAQIDKYREVFRVALERANLIDTALAEYLDERPAGGGELEMVTPEEDVPIFKCPKCGANMVLRERREGGGKYIGCMSFPTCNNAIWFPDSVTGVEVQPEVCTSCSGDFRKLKIKLRPRAIPMFGSVYDTCIGGCDNMFNEVMNIREDTVRRVERPPDSGYASGSTQGSNSTQSFPRREGGPGSRGGISSTQGNGSSSRGGGSSNRGGSSSTRGGGSSSRGGGSSNRGGGSGSSVGLMRPQNPPPRQPPTNSRPGDWNNSNKRTTDEWGGGPSAQQSHPKRPKVGNSSRENVNPRASTTNDNNNYLCDCHDRAIQLTVRKDGVNKGRLFYKCAKPQGTGCDFFLWASDDEVPAQPPTANAWGRQDNDQRNSFPSNAHSRNDEWGKKNDGGDWNQGNAGGPSWGDDETPMCICGQPASRLTVKKEGPNKGRAFYGCPQGMASTCKFFEWADEGGGGGTSFASTGQGRGRGGRGRGAGAPRGSGGKRRCGNCGVEGHTRRTCPDNAMDN